MNPFQKFLNKFPEEHQPTVRKIIVHGGGWSTYKAPTSYPQAITNKEWFELWSDVVRTKPLLQYHLLREGTDHGFQPTFWHMSWMVTDELKQKVVNYVTKEKSGE